MFSKYKLNQVQIWGAYYDPIKQIDSIPIMDEEEITNVDMRLTWDSENRLKQVNNNSHDARYLYDSGGQRVLKRGNRTEIVYPTQFIQLDRAKKLYTKHIFVGTSRISSKLCSVTNYFKDIEFEKRNNYTYHPDHLGSTSFVSDFRGEIYEYYQYTPYGEIWAEKSDILDKITHLFTSKELDAESGFYYFGARYLEPMTSRWLSCDPILNEYLPSGDKERDKSLPGMGGVFNPVNLNLYQYCANSPLNYTDPDGNIIMSVKIFFNNFFQNDSLGKHDRNLGNSKITITNYGCRLVSITRVANLINWDVHDTASGDVIESNLMGINCKAFTGAKLNGVQAVETLIEAITKVDVNVTRYKKSSNLKKVLNNFSKSGRKYYVIGGYKVGNGYHYVNIEGIDESGNVQINNSYDGGRSSISTDKLEIIDVIRVNDN